jgi:D-alanyl-D-alanine carboxypeptidase
VPFVDEEYTPNPYNTPFVSCRNYIVIEPHRNKMVIGKCPEEICEMASLTKIMTTLTVIILAQRLKLPLKSTWFEVSEFAASMIGTSACLLPGQRLTIIDLLYGLMLPSGNDAAMCLAENFSTLLKPKSESKLKF